MTELKDKVLEKITEGNIAPKPRWHFAVRNALVWAAGILFLLVGAVAVSVMIFVIDNGAWEVREALGHGHVGHMIQIFPLMWFVAFLLFIGVARWALSHTKRGYRYPLRVIVPVIFFASIVLGFSVHLFGVGKYFDDEIGHRVPYYETLEKKRDRMMHAPQVGRITGIIESPEGTTFILVNKKKGTQWTVEAHEVPEKAQALIVEGAAVLVVGEKEDKREFEAHNIHTLREVKERLLEIKKDRAQKAPGDDKRRKPEGQQPVK